MNGKDIREVATQFMRDNQFWNFLEALSKSDVIQQMAREKYDRMQERLGFFVSRAPEGLEEQAEDVKMEMNEYSFEMFMEDFKLNYAIFEYEALKPVLDLSEDLFFHIRICSIARDAIHVYNSKAVEKAEEILDGLLNNFVDESLMHLFDGYIPDDMPTEVARAITDFGLGVIIPQDILIAFLEKFAEDDD